MRDYNSLLIEGLTNKSEDDLSRLASKYTYTVRGFCSSRMCVGADNKSMVEKNFENRPDECPDCGYSLVYKKVRMFS